jgi:hypothetical protein
MEMAAEEMLPPLALAIPVGGMAGPGIRRDFPVPFGRIGRDRIEIVGGSQIDEIECQELRVVISISVITNVRTNSGDFMDIGLRGDPAEREGRGSGDARHLTIDPAAESAQEFTPGRLLG